jgi:parallel beta-helix repeat protein
MISGNMANLGGGISCDSSSNYIITCIISGNTAEWGGGGIYCNNYSGTTITNCTISENTAIAYGGGGIFCDDDSYPSITECTISANTADDKGGGIYCNNSDPIITNCTISGNTVGYNGGGISCDYSSPIILNTIVEGNFGNYGVYLLNSANASITYSDFYNNQNGNFYNPPQGVGTIVTVNANGDSCDVFHNIFLDPLFYSITGDSAYYLTANSSCIDAGDPTSPLDPDSTIADMGAYYFNQAAGIVNPTFSFSLFTFNLSPAYPNPFNSETVLSFQLRDASMVKLIVYDISGREVQSLVNGHWSLGKHSVEWDAEGMASGIYLIRMKAGDFSQVQKIVLMK